MTVKTYETDGITINIDHELCTGCGACIDVCPADVFELVDELSTAPRVEDCVECCECVEGCPEGAIEHGSC